MTNLFAPTTSTNTTPASSPFGADAQGRPSSGNGKGFKIAPTPVGVLRGTVTELKATQKGHILLVKCDDPIYVEAEPVGIWIGTDTRLLLKVAGALGITSEIRDGMVFFADGEGNVDESAFKAKPGLFVFIPGKDMSPRISTYLPKKDVSPMWDQYMDEANFSEEQLAALKKATGAVPGDLHHLFT